MGIFLKTIQVVNAIVKYSLEPHFEVAKIHNYRYSPIFRSMDNHFVNWIKL